MSLKIIEFFEMYCNHFGLDKYIRYETDVMFVKKAENFAKDGKWAVCNRDKVTGEEKTEIFDAALICTGKYLVLIY